MQVISIILAVLICNQFQQGDLFAGDEDLKYTDEIAQRLSNRVKDITNKYTAYQDINKEFEKYSNEFIMTVTDGKQLNEEFKNGIENLFKSKADLLYKIKSTAENLKSNYEFANKNDKNLKNYKYINVRNIYDGDNMTEIIPTFSDKVAINMTESFVQIPTNIYNLSTGILNTAKWTEGVDQTFMTNFNNHTDETLLYQYYCDSTGLFRIYPGNKNGYNESKTDLYDCRHRVWYIQASSSPKDVVIIIDVSGSMTGNNIAIARIAASSLVDTLQENDYFNIITVNKEFKYISCIRYLLQATKENKEIMKTALKNITSPFGIQNMDVGVEEAFKILHHSGSDYNRTSADCNKVIMILTDRVEGSYAAKDIFQKYNANKTVRAFAFLVGRKGSPEKTALQAMTCDNNGKLYEMETLGNIWDTVLEYIQVLSRPIAQSNDTSLINHTPIYLDSTGLGMMLTVSLAVFHNNELTGVTGTDVAIASLKNIIPKEKFGIFSHNLVINNNGFVLLHKDLQDQIGYLPTPPNIFLDDLEHSLNHSESEFLKLAMINQESGTNQSQTYILYDNYQRISIVSTRYYYTPIDNTEFSSAVAIVNVDENNYQVVDQTVNKLLQSGLEALTPSTVIYFRNESDIISSEGESLCVLCTQKDTPTGMNMTNYTIQGKQFVHIAPWMYCNITAQSQSTTPKSIKTYPTVSEIYNHIKHIDTVNEAPRNCDKYLLNKLLFTAGIVDKYINQSWENVITNNDENVHNLFVITDGGYGKYYQTINSTENIDRDVYKNPIYQQAALNTPASIIISSVNTDVISMSGIVRSQLSDNKKLLSAVSGVGLNSNFVKEILLNETRDGEKCSNQDKSICLIIDEHGFIITSNQDNKYNGRFFSALIGPLVEHFATFSIFEKIVLDDTQAECFEEENGDKSASNILLTPAKILFQLITYIFGVSYWLIVQSIIFTFTILGQFFHQSEAANTKIKVSCTREMSFYLFNEKLWNNIKDKHLRRVQCSLNCYQTYSLSRIPDTNLLFLIADIPCEACLMNGIKRQQYKTKHSNVCDMKERYRRKPSRCYNNYKTEEGFSCNSNMKKSSLFLFIITIVTIFVTNFYI